MAKSAPNYKEQYNKERRRIQRFISRAVKRGFEFKEGTLPERPEKYTKREVEKLKRLTPEKLYKKSTYREITTGREIKGTERRKEERSIAAKRAAQTREFNKRERERREKHPDRYYEPESRPSDIPSTDYDREWEEQHPDDIDTEGRYWYEPDYNDWEQDSIWYEPEPEPEPIDETIYWNIVNEIEQYDPYTVWASKGSKSGRNWFAEQKEKDKNQLQRVLENAVSSQGLRDVMKRCADNAEVITGLVNTILYGSDRDTVQVDISRFASIILGRGLSLEEAIEISEDELANNEFE